MARATESCPNKKCPWLKHEDNEEKEAFKRALSPPTACHLCPNCETRLKAD